MQQNNSLLSVRGFILIAIVVLLVVGTILFLNAQRGYKIDLLVAPSDATIYIDNVSVRGSSTRRNAGEYELRVEREGFQDYQQTINVAEDSQQFIVALTPLTRNAIELAQEDDAYLQIEDEFGEQAVTTGDILLDNNPIINELPHQSFFLSIGYRLDPDDPTEESIIVEVDAGEGYRELALQKIKDWGYDPTNLNINFSNHRNPFNE